MRRSKHEAEGQNAPAGGGWALRGRERPPAGRPAACAAVPFARAPAPPHQHAPRRTGARAVPAARIPRGAASFAPAMAAPTRSLAASSSFLGAAVPLPQSRRGAVPARRHAAAVCNAGGLPLPPSHGQPVASVQHAQQPLPQVASAPAAAPSAAGVCPACVARRGGAALTRAAAPNRCDLQSCPSPWPPAWLARASHRCWAARSASTARAWRSSCPAMRPRWPRTSRTRPAAPGCSALLRPVALPLAAAGRAAPAWRSADARTTAAAARYHQEFSATTTTLTTDKLKVRAAPQTARRRVP
jgi:hypothetical protein